jgi:tRNA (guanine-N7-)-methyltransferase
MDWSNLYPEFIDSGFTEKEQRKSSEQKLNMLKKNVEIADIGCGYGGLLFALSLQMPETLILGLEIRTSVTQFVQQKIVAMRKNPSISNEENVESIPSTNDEISLGKHPYQNIACIRANTMKFLPNFFRKSQLKAIFICFPDPHFKARKHKARIVSTGLAAEYAFVLRPGGKLYTITDVEELHGWMVDKMAAHASFERVGDEEMDADELVKLMSTKTEEAKKVERNKGVKYVAAFRRLEEPGWPDE